MTDESAYNCARDARSDDIVFFNSSSLIVRVLAVGERMWYESNFCGNSSKYSPVSSLSSAVIANGG